MTPLGGTDRVVGVYGISLIFEIGQPIGEHDKTPCQKYNHHTAASVPSAVVDYAHLLGQEGSIFFYTRLYLHDKRLAVTVGTKYFLPRSFNPDRPARFYGKQTGTEFVGKKVYLSPKGPAHICLPDSDRRERKRKGAGQFGPF